MRTRTGSLLLVSMLACCVTGRARAQQLPTNPLPDAVAPRRPTDDDDVADDAGFIRFEYLCWWIKDAPLPTPLVTSGTPSGRGIIGALGTSVLAGAGQQSFGGLSGGRLHCLEWTDAEGDYGIEAGAFYFEHHAVHFQASAEAGGNSVLAIPFIDVSSGRPQASSLVLAQPGVSSGSAALYDGTQLWGVDFNFALNLDDWLGDTSANVRLLTGLNIVDLNESLQLMTDSNLASGLAHHSDIFAARSNFMGIDLAAVVGQRWRRAYFELIPKFSVGANITSDYIVAQDVSPAIFSVN
ncbi:MAG TPA: BBP7 family outer membrane beta-barrel protein, partial [Pirellulales bacterium]|nr:BBP7 family outer membrane beta-barrel protein [Pirellulales bacterium]